MFKLLLHDFTPEVDYSRQAAEQAEACDSCKPFCRLLLRNHAVLTMLS